MRTVRKIGIAALFLSLGLAAPVFAHQNDQERPQKKEQKRKEKSQREERGRTERQKRQPQREERRQREPQTRQERQQREPQRREQRAYRPEQRRTPEQARQEHEAWQRDRARNWQREHRTWQQRGGYRGYRIPENHYRLYFGPRHFFRMNSLRVVYIGGHRRFWYGGYWFGLMDPWPQYWAADWYAMDEMYIIYYGGGYYLCNRHYPGIRIAIVFYGG